MSNAAAPAQQGVLPWLEELLDLKVWDAREVLTAAASRVAQWMHCDKVDAFVFDEARDALVAVGTSDTPLGRLQRELGLDVLPLAAGGRVAEVYRTGRTHFTGHAEQDEMELPGIINDLGVRSAIHAALDIAGARQGVLSVVSQRTEHFQDPDKRQLELFARWVGVLAHRADLVSRLRQEETERARHAAAEELLTVVSHDVRNHLAPLSNRLQVMKLKLGSGREIAAEDLDAPIAAVGRLARLTDEILDVTRLDQGMFSLDLAPVDLVQLVGDTCQAFAGPSAEVVVDAPASLVVQADAKRLRQALENVIANGVRHSPPGRPLRVVLTSSQEASEARIDLIDEGSGIPPELLGRLFDRFATGGRSHGIGLGLYLSERIARAHGGSLSVESSPGAGACFSFRLPLTEGRAP